MREHIRLGRLTGVNVGIPRSIFVDELRQMKVAELRSPRQDQHI